MILADRRQTGYRNDHNWRNQYHSSHHRCLYGGCFDKYVPLLPARSQRERAITTKESYEATPPTQRSANLLCHTLRFGLLLKGIKTTPTFGKFTISNDAIIVSFSLASIFATTPACILWSWVGLVRLKLHTVGIVTDDVRTLSSIHTYTQFIHSDKMIITTISYCIHESTPCTLHSFLSWWHRLGQS